MEINRKWSVSPSFCLALAVSVVIIPLKWVLSWLVAMIIHEFAHYLALRSTGVSVSNIELGTSGARMDTQGLCGWRESVCAAAGPIGSLLLCAFSSAFPSVALCGFIHGIFNLLPLFPLDGGRILHGAIGRFRSGRVVMNILEWGILSAFGIFAIRCLVCLSLGPVPLILYIMMLAKWRKIKIPCKAGHLAVQ